MEIRHKYRRLKETLERYPVTLKRNPIINKKTKIFTIGSCFAIEIAEYLNKNGYNVFNPELVASAEYNLIWYNTYSILCQLSRPQGYEACN